MVKRQGEQVARRVSEQRCAASREVSVAFRASKKKKNSANKTKNHIKNNGTQITMFVIHDCKTPTCNSIRDSQA